MRLVELSKERTLPYSGRITVEVGQEVKAQDDVAILDYVAGRVYRVAAAKALSLSPSKLEDVTIVKMGDHVHKGQVLAINSVFYQPFVCVSPIEGVVGIISRHLGQIYLRDYIPLDNDVEDDVVFDLNELFPKYKAKQLANKILVKVGSKISPSQIIAKVSMREYVASNVYGQIMSIENNRVVISAYKINSKLKAYIPGTVTEILGRETVRIKGNVIQLQGVYGLGGERQGYLRVIKDATKMLQAEDLSQSDAENILFAAGGISKEALVRANEIGVKGVVVPSMSFIDVKEFAGIDFVPGITGTESINTALLLVEGFIDQKMDPKITEFVSHFDGLWVSFTGTTHIRAGALRPELILPLIPDLSGIPEKVDDEIKVGSVVEIKRSGEWHGKVGIVREILAQPIVLPSLVRVLAAVVEVGTQRATVPLTNIVAKGEK